MRPHAPLERFVPGLPGQIKAEHLHRYALARPLAQNQDVLDLACGEGYGAALLARGARSVVGVDIDAATIEGAAERYVRPNLKFQRGSCDAIPLPDASLDGVVSFETLEHHDRHDEMMREVKRVLRPGGWLLISSPNRVAYSQEPGHLNPFHVRELSLDEFDALLRRHFAFVDIVGQKFAVASLVFPLRNDPDAEWAGYTSAGERGVETLEAPVYFVALCRDQPGAESVGASIYLDNEVVEHHFQDVRATKTALSRMQDHPLWRVALRLRQLRLRQLRLRQQLRGR